MKVCVSCFCHASVKFGLTTAQHCLRQIQLQSCFEKRKKKSHPWHLQGTSSKMFYSFRLSADLNSFNMMLSGSDLSSKGQKDQRETQMFKDGRTSHLSKELQQKLEKRYVDESTEPATRYSYGSCSAMQTHATKLPAHSFCADVNARGGLELNQQPCFLLLGSLPLPACAAGVPKLLVSIHTYN